MTKNHESLRFCAAETDFEKVHFRFVYLFSVGFEKDFEKSPSHQNRTFPKSYRNNSLLNYM